MDIYLEVEKLINYSILNGFIEEEDKILVTNLVLESIDLDSYREFSDDELIKIKEIVKDIKYPTELLDNIVKWASENGKMKNNTLTFQDLLNSKIMGQIIPRTSEIRRKFWLKYEKDKEKATEYFYDLSKKSNYIRTDRISKNIHWNYENEYGNLEITINLSKPEKDPREIAMAKNKVLKNYPKGLLSKENEGYMGRLDHPGRQNHRIIKLNLTDEDWYFQYSPYTYYDEHSIVFSGIERPMKIDKSGFERLFQFVEKFPHYFIGSNADLPIVGGSILTHDHFQAGKHVFPMEMAKITKKINFKGFEDVEAGIVNWPMSVIRISGEKERLLELSDLILKKWIDYSDVESGILAYSNSERHNTITPIVRFKNGKYEIDLVLRNNRTTEQYPLGIYHPHSEHHNIKKENIGLIEVMGLAVLPGRLKDEMNQIKEILNKTINCESFEKNNYSLLYEQIKNNEELEKHCDWLKTYLESEIGEIVYADIDKFIKTAIGETFSRVLKDCGVFKNLDSFMKFVDFI